MQATPMAINQAPIRNLQPNLVPNPFYMEPNTYIVPTKKEITPLTVLIPPIFRSYAQTTIGCPRNVTYNTGFPVFPSPLSTSSMKSIDFRKTDNMLKKINVSQLDVQMRVSSKKTILNWETPRTQKPVKFIIYSTDTLNRKIQTVVLYPAPICSLELNTIPGNWSSVQIQCKSTDDRFLISEWSKQFKAELNDEEYQNLMSKCLAFLNSKPFKIAYQEFKVIYRCKPKAYWDQIHNYSNGIMQKYLKDDNGQPGNRINRNIKGLFFSANTNPDGTLPSSSYFGNIRMICDAYYFLNPTVHQFYFADFYCNTLKHYATIVVCVANSETDRYCQEKLMKIDPFSNPFIRVQSVTGSYGGPWKFFLNRTLLVEIFYTEDISLAIGHFTDVQTVGAGTSRSNGVPNNKKCNICNLYPAGSSSI